jgi:hypothetical protein
MRVIEPAAARFEPDHRWGDLTHARRGGGRLLMTHEDGYALAYLPLCFVRILSDHASRTWLKSAGHSDPLMTAIGPGRLIRHFALSVTNCR